MTYEEILAFARELRKKQTPAEKFFWQKVRNRRLFGKKFTRQFIIQHDNNPWGIEHICTWEQKEFIKKC
jgi:very-short-patch-repair endonuclease